MRKIFSIMVVLGLVLGMVVMTAPAAAQTCTGTVLLSNDCAGATSTYNLTFTPTKSMLPGNDLFILEFGAGTTFGTVVTVSVDGTAVLAANIDKSAPPTLTFPTPVAVTAGTPVEISVTGVKNPADGKYKLLYSIKLVCCDPEYQGCADYTIKPAKSTYKFVLDFGATYEDIALDFVPPFRACGQPGYGYFDAPAGDDYFEGTGNNFTEFDLWLMADVEGCAGYDPVIINFWLEDAPADSTVSLYLYGWNGTPSLLGWHLFELTLPEDDEDVDIYQWGFAPDGFALAADHNEASPGRIHFDTVGDYEICFELEYMGEDDDCSPIEGGILAERCVEAKVYQDKEAFQLEFGPKWNLMSLPLIPFETDIDAILAAMNEDGLSQLKSIWNYDRCSDAWFAWGNGQTSLTDIEDGKAYWVRMLKATEEGFDALIEPTLWVWGTARPMPPQGPPSYAVCEGPNMVGFLPMWNFAVAPSVPLTALDSDYLWNFWSIAVTYPDYGTVYGWDGLNWEMGLPGTVTLEPGEGYWIVFDRDGVIYP